MSYVIDGPVTLGTSGQTTTIIGNISLGATGVTTSLSGNITMPDALTAAGQIPYRGATFLQGLSAVDKGILTTSTTTPSWVAPGSNGQVLTMVAGSPAWSSSGESGGYGFLARKTGTQAGISSATTVTTWSTSSNPEYDTTSGAFVGATGLYTVSDTGYYTINAAVQLTQSSNAGAHTMTIVSDPAGVPTTLFTRTVQAAASNSQPTVLSICTNANLTAATVLAVQVSTSSGTITVAATPATWFGVVRNSL